MEFVLESNFFWRKVFVLFIAFSKRSRWAEMECHLSLLEQRKIDRAKNDQSFTSFEYKNPNKILKTLKAKISGRAMIQVASSPMVCHPKFDFRDGCNNQIDGLKVGIYPVKKLLVYCLQPDSGLAVSIVLF